MTHPENRQGDGDASRRSSLLGQTTPVESRRIICVAEIDRFGGLRERVGYSTSNALIGEVARRIQGALPGCEIGRAGRTSVEFVFAALSAEQARASLRHAVETIERPFRADDVDFDLTVAIGAVDAGARAIDDRQLDAAAAALRTAQDRHEKVHLEQADGLQCDAPDDLSLIRDLRRAIRCDELTLHYQPKLRSRTETIDSAEALLRWDHPERGPVRIDKLIELAEAAGSIRDLTFWVVERAIAEQRALAALGYRLTIFVNISGLLLPDTSFADWALSRLAGMGGIGFEITETAVIDDSAVAIRNLQRFAEAGIRIAIDDYGSGLSSLAYLKQLPAHELKIDRMFVSGLTESQRDPLLVRSTIDLAHALEMEVTAEGVDDAIALSLLRVMGCDMVQGYLISRPLPFDALVAFLGDDARRAPATLTLDAWASAAGANQR